MEFLTQETPGKIMSLVGAALMSMAFLFAVTTTNASFSRVYDPSPALSALDPQNVMAVLDVASNKYAMFIDQNLTQPALQSYQLAADNVKYIADNATFEVAMLTNNQNLLPQEQVMYYPRVAGAYIRAVSSQ